MLPNAAAAAAVPAAGLFAPLPTIPCCPVCGAPFPCANPWTKSRSESWTMPPWQSWKITRGLLVQDLQRELSSLPGVLVEDKGLTISVHYRQTPDELAGDVESRFNTTVSPYLKPGGWKATAGKKVLEARPDIPWDKGKAIAYLQAAYQSASLTFYFGDDLTDEDGFEAVQSSGGIAVFVGQARQPTRAIHRLDSPQEVVETLQLIDRI